MAVETKEVKTKFNTLYIDPTVMKRIMYYTQAAEGEVSGLGTVVLDEKGRHVVNAVYLLEQESSGADTELSPAAISTLMTNMMMKNEDPATLKFWWHSHANMGVFWSGTDDTCAETLSKEFAFSLVVNKAGEKKCRLDLYAPFRITFDGVKVTELATEDTDLKAECEREVKEKVKSPHTKWQGWNKDSGVIHGGSHMMRGYSYDEGYDDIGYGFKDKSFFGKEKKIPKSRVDLPADLVDDIEKLKDFAETNEAYGGIFAPDAWMEFITEKLKAIVTEKFNGKGECAAPLTFDKEYDMCSKTCKINKKCAYWTMFFEETERDAVPLLGHVATEETAVTGGIA